MASNLVQLTWYGANVLSMLLCATVVSLAGFLMNTFVAKLGCPRAIQSLFFCMLEAQD